MLKKLAIIGFGSTMIGIGINGFILPLHLINGGFLGISLLLKYIWGFKTGITFIFLNIPVYMFAFKSDPIYFINGVIGALCTGLMIELFMPLNGIFHLPILSSVIVGAVIIGSGVGVMLRNHISPGGMDLLALIIAKWSKVNVGVIMFAMDAVIIITGLFLLQDVKLFYSLIIVAIVGLLASIITTINIERH
ncbi:YitT family protein [Bacillus sp. ISL-40]|uniref:YitT family protein n=1 Tax=unclassified Bacillus (in: firmicutes) TaxID=185979 RepID=UPI001BE8640F|nr:MULTISPECIES: YitT family protein [unclassified Bacillus (in: firmicutes)]MBT2699695.1 YitT family protein [Bacillus sp. ISL-40]MBT2744315.1 YitT family protein [Bacillus sp. ISL-77]